MEIVEPEEPGLRHEEERSFESRVVSVRGVVVEVPAELPVASTKKGRC